MENKGSLWTFYHFLRTFFHVGMPMIYRFFTRSVFHEKCPFCASQIDFHRCGWTIQVVTLWFISQHMEKLLLPQVRSGMIIPTTQGNPQYHEMMGFSKSIMGSNFFVASAASPEAVSSSKAATGDHCRHRGVFGIRWSQVRNRSKRQGLVS